MWFRRKNTNGDVASEEALEDAQKSLRTVQRRGSEVTNVATALRDIRERNHFGEALEAIISRRYGGPINDT